MTESDIKNIKHFFECHGVAPLSESGDADDYEEVRCLVKNNKEAEYLCACVPTKSFYPRLKNFDSVCSFLCHADIENAMERYSIKDGVPVVWIGDGNYLIVKFEGGLALTKYAKYWKFDAIKINSWHEDYARFLSDMWTGEIGPWKTLSGYDDDDDEDNTSEAKKRNELMGFKKRCS